MENYIEARMVPKGLRVTLSPASRSRSESLLKMWKKELTESTLRFMQISLQKEKGILDLTSRKSKQKIDQALKLRGYIVT